MLSHRQALALWFWGLSQASSRALFLVPRPPLLLGSPDWDSRISCAPHCPQHLSSIPPVLLNRSMSSASTASPSPSRSDPPRGLPIVFCAGTMAGLRLRPRGVSSRLLRPLRLCA